MNNDRAFFQYLKSHKEVFFLAFLLLLGVVFLLLGSGNFLFSQEGEASEASTEERIETLLSDVKGVGVAEVFILYESETQATYYGQSAEEKRVVSVSVVCDGGDNPAIQAELTKMLTSLFGIGANRVTVLKRNA